jgi:excinuclease UvrABC ATPase subunit
VFGSGPCAGRASTTSRTSTSRFRAIKLVVITGLSGSGKSSLAFDTIFAEGQRKYMESLSAYARQFLEQLKKPDVDEVEGIPPTIAIEQRSGERQPALDGGDDDGDLRLPATALRALRQAVLVGR